MDSPAVKKIKKYMKRQGLTSNALAYKLDVDRSVVKRWIDGTYRPSRSREKEINDFFGIIDEWL